jgi:hypothetical protein
MRLFFMMLIDCSSYTPEYAKIDSINIAATELPAA